MIIRIAVADDHVLFCQAICRVINEWEHCKVILQAASGKQLIEQIDPNHPPDLALTDLCMPGMSGYETIRVLKKKYPAIKVMVISMYESKETLLELLKAGAEGFLHKSADERQLKKGVQEMMRTGYYFADQSIARIFKQVMDKGKLSLIKGLSDEEIVLLKFICTEKTYKEIACDMKISERHVEYLRDNLSERFGLQGRTALALHAAENGLTI